MAAEPGLTQNMLAAGKLHDILYGQKVVLVAKLGYQIEFFFDQRDGVLGYALGPALAGSVIGQLAQVSPGVRCGGTKSSGYS